MNLDQRRAADTSGSPTRGKLIEATQRLLAAGGTDALSSRAIATGAGANLASITYYFGSKEQLVTESLIGAARDLLAPVVATLSSEGDPINKMIESMVLLNRILDEHRDHLVAYVQALAAATANPSIAATLQALQRDITQLLSQQISAQLSAGQLPSWISPDAMAQLIVSVMHGALLGSVIDPKRTEPAAIGAQFAQLLIGVRTPGDSDGRP
jgi:AcrR family transcriptional regulator